MKKLTYILRNNVLLSVEIFMVNVPMVFYCSIYGYCGMDDSYCRYGCQKEYCICENLPKL